MTWDDVEDIAIELSENFPDTDPLTVRFTDLRNHVLAIEDFEGDPAKSTEGKLEAIQMAWYDEWKDRQ